MCAVVVAVATAATAAVVAVDVGVLELQAGDPHGGGGDP